MPDLATDHRRIDDRWDDSLAPGEHDPLAQVAYASRLLGSDPRLVLHGGGNTSVKATARDVRGEELELVHVKASGHDLATIRPEGFAPLRLERLRRLVRLPALDDTTMVNEFRCASVDASSPTASIEALLHALLPHRYVLHTHADAVVTLTDTALTDAELVAAFGGDVEVLPYLRPGFDLARRVHELLEARGGRAPAALVLRNHGLFTFADDARTAYEAHLRFVNAAAARIAAARPGGPPTGRRSPDAAGAVPVDALAKLRADVSRAAGHPVLLLTERDAEVAEFLALPNLGAVTRNGTATLEHVIRIKPWPLIGRDVEEYVRQYRERFNRFAGAYDDLTPLDPAPRVILDDELGLVSVGRTPAEAGIVRDIYRHTIRIITDAEALGGYRSVSDADLFDIEYWELEQAKLRVRGSRPPLEGQVAVVAGAGDALPVRQALEASGAQVVENASPGQLDAAVRRAVEAWGGVDLVVTVGHKPGSGTWRDVLRHGWRGGSEVHISAESDRVTVTGPRGQIAAELADASALAAAIGLVR